MTLKTKSEMSLHRRVLSGMRNIAAGKGKVCGREKDVLNGPWQLHYSSMREFRSSGVKISCGRRMFSENKLHLKLTCDTRRVPVEFLTR